MANKLTKLDARYNGNHQFTHKVEFGGRNGWSRRKNFVAATHWLWEHFGPSCEQSMVHCLEQLPLWSWESNKGFNTSIFLTGAALTQFLLMKERFEINYV